MTVTADVVYTINLAQCTLHNTNNQPYHTPVEQNRVRFPHPVNEGNYWHLTYQSTSSVTYDYNQFKCHCKKISFRFK